MCDLNQYLNDDVISEIKSFNTNEAYIKELKQKNVLECVLLSNPLFICSMWLCYCKGG